VPVVALRWELGGHTRFTPTPGRWAKGPFSHQCYSCSLLPKSRCAPLTQDTAAEAGGIGGAGPSCRKHRGGGEGIATKQGRWSTFVTLGGRMAMVVLGPGHSRAEAEPAQSAAAQAKERPARLKPKGGRGQAPAQTLGGIVSCELSSGLECVRTNEAAFRPGLLDNARGLLATAGTGDFL
jgi:hypothetical protein